MAVPGGNGKPRKAITSCMRIKHTHTHRRNICTQPIVDGTWCDVGVCRPGCVPRSIFVRSWDVHRAWPGIASVLPQTAKHIASLKHNQLQRLYDLTELLRGCQTCAACANDRDAEHRRVEGQAWSVHSQYKHNGAATNECALRSAERLSYTTNK